MLSGGCRPFGDCRKPRILSSGKTKTKPHKPCGVKQGSPYQDLQVSPQTTHGSISRSHLSPSLRFGILRCASGSSGAPVTHTGPKSHLKATESTSTTLPQSPNPTRPGLLPAAQLIWISRMMIMFSAQSPVSERLPVAAQKLPRGEKTLYIHCAVRKKPTNGRLPRCTFVFPLARDGFIFTV